MNVAPIILLAAAAASAAPSMPAVKQGVDLWQAGDYERAVQAWMPPAQSGDPDAQFNLAQAYKLGRGVTPDMRQAETWYRKAAEHNHPQAGAMLGLIMFQNGDRRSAMPWIQKAAEQGDPRAQYVYGTALFNGDAVGKDWPRAYAMMTKAAAAGLPQASTSLSQMDQFIPLAERQQGLGLAKGGTARTFRVAGAYTSPPPPPAIRATDLPPSRVAERPPAPVAAAAPPAPPRAVKTAAAAPKPAAKPAAPTAGGWRIQLGAFGDPAAAHGAWDKLARRPGLGALRPFIVKAGAVTRLQAGPFGSRAAATQACKLAAAANQACFPVAG